MQERSGSVVECLTGDREAAVRASPASLRCGPWARHIYPSLELVQPRKTHPCLTERLLMGHKESNQTNKKLINAQKIGHWAQMIDRAVITHFYKNGIVILCIFNSLPPPPPPPPPLGFFFFCIFVVCWFFYYKIKFFKKFFQEFDQSVKQFGSRSGPTFCRAWSGSYLFAKVISRQHRGVKELKVQ